MGMDLFRTDFRCDIAFPGWDAPPEQLNAWTSSFTAAAKAAARRGDLLSIGRTSWGAALTIAEDWGWQPRGTTLATAPGPLHHWNGNYGDNNGQRVSDADSGNLAYALERALDATAPDQCLVETLTDAALEYDGDDRRFASPSAQAMLQDPDGRNVLNRLADYCGHRGFDIC